jgi:hypothetical protein
MAEIAIFRIEGSKIVEKWGRRSAWHVPPARHPPARSCSSSGWSPEVYVAVRYLDMLPFRGGAPQVRSGKTASSAGRNEGGFAHRASHPKDECKLNDLA